MKRLASLALALAALAAGLPALAQPAGGDASRRFERPQPQRDYRREQESRPHWMEREEGERGRIGRMTPEERQQLRRDIREHGREVYRRRSQD